MNSSERKGPIGLIPLHHECLFLERKFGDVLSKALGAWLGAVNYHEQFCHAEDEGKFDPSILATSEKEFARFAELSAQVGKLFIRIADVRQRLEATEGELHGDIWPEGTAFPGTGHPEREAQLTAFWQRLAEAHSRPKPRTLASPSPGSP